MPVFFQRQRLSSLSKVVLLSALALSGCSEDTPVTNNDNSTNNITNIFDDAPVGVMTVSSICGEVVVLDAAGSYDPEGNTLSYKWKLVEAPAGSNLGASFTSVSSPRVTTLVDKAGMYVFQLMLFDGSKQTVTQTVAASAVPPAEGGLDTMTCYGRSNVAEFPAAIRKGVVIARPGQALTLDATLANDSDATYQWKLVSSPAGSLVSLGGAGTPTPGFTPDVSGDYKLSLSVKKSGQAWAAAVVIVRASSLKAISLDYAVARAALITGTNKVASISGDNTFRIHNLANGNDYSIVLPGIARDFSISPDGSRALVLQKTMLSLINTSTHTLVSSWPLGSGGSSTGINPLYVLMVNNQKAYVYGFDGSSYTRLYPFDAGTGTLDNAISGYSGYSYYSSSVEMKRFSTDAFFFKDDSSYLYKVALNPDGSVAQIYSTAQPNNCSGASLLSGALLASCGAVYGVSGTPPVLAFQSYIDLGSSQSYEFPAGNMTLSADGLGMYAFKNIGYGMSDDILRFRTDTWTLESSITLPVVESGSALVLPNTQEILVDTNNPLVIIGRHQLSSGGYSYYLLKPY